MRSDEQRARDQYMVQLDGLRCLAVMAVLLAHTWFVRPVAWALDAVVEPSSLGHFGVRLFFVLSGFLISGILLDSRTSSMGNRKTLMFSARQFYIRRCLRIWPLYYLVVVGLVIANFADARVVTPWLFTYTTNFYIWAHLSWIKLGYFWTLAVEEQFYVVWPWLVLFAPARWLTALLVMAIASGPLYRLVATFAYAADIQAGQVTSGTFTLAVLDSLGLGALLAMMVRRLDPQTAVRRLRRIVLPAGLTIYLVAALLFVVGDNHVSYAISEFGTALVFCWLVGTASYGFNGRFGKFLSWAPIAYLGKISYGIYIYHEITRLTLQYLAPGMGFAIPPGPRLFLVNTTLTIAIASASWYLFEAPINGLKRFFPYERERAPSGPTAVTPSPAN